MGNLLKVSVFITSSYQVGERRVNVIYAILMSVWPSASTPAINELYLICIIFNCCSPFLILRGYRGKGKTFVSKNKHSMLK